MKYPRVKPELDKRRKLSPSDVENIKTMKEGHTTLREIAAKYGVSTFVVWYHTTDPEKAKKHRSEVVAWLNKRMKDPVYRERHRLILKRCLKRRLKTDEDFRVWRSKMSILNRKRSPESIEYYRKKNREWLSKNREDVNRRRRENRLLGDSKNSTKKSKTAKTSSFTI